MDDLLRCALPHSSGWRCSWGLYTRVAGHSHSTREARFRSPWGSGPGQIHSCAVGGSEMSRGKWGRDGPPDEAYGRVTNPERYQPLHAAAVELLGWLEREFAVERRDGYDADDERWVARPLGTPTRLVPSHPQAAHITVVLTTFPGVYINFGSWFREAFPACGCDACDESPEELIKDMTRMVEAFVSSGFSERIEVPRFWGDGRRTWELQFKDGSGSRALGGRIPRARALELTGGERSVTLEWMPWPRRDPTARPSVSRVYGGG